MKSPGQNWFLEEPTELWLKCTVTIDTHRLALRALSSQCTNHHYDSPPQIHLFYRGCSHNF